MNRRKIKQLATFATTLLVSLLAVSCGGGGGGGGDPLPIDLTAVFTGDAAGDVSMDAGASSGPDFDVQIKADGIDDLSGAAFHVFYDHTTASLVGWSGAGSILGPTGDYRAALVAPGELAVSAALPDDGAGIDNATGLLITLSFQATAATGQNRFTFGSDSPPDISRRVKICPTAGQPCSDIVPSSWTGGNLVVIE